jgi:XTP/dITP diphosphohydrolase
MKMVLASNNAGKLAELQTMFGALNVQLVRQSELNISEAEEPYKTFVENALAKARHAAEQSGLPAVADDAGLCIDAFGGLPGVDTAYYCTQFGYEKSDANNVTAVLEQMADVENRRAAMVSTLVAVRSAYDPEPLIAVGRVVVDIAIAQKFFQIQARKTRGQIQNHWRLEVLLQCQPPPVPPQSKALGRRHF